MTINQNKGRVLLGKTVAEIKVEPTVIGDKRINSLQWIRFTDGTVLWFNATETEYEPLVEMSGFGPRGGKL